MRTQSRIETMMLDTFNDERLQKMQSDELSDSLERGSDGHVFAVFIVIVEEKTEAPAKEDAAKEEKPAAEAAPEKKAEVKEKKAVKDKPAEVKEEEKPEKATPAVPEEPAAADKEDAAGSKKTAKDEE